MNIILPTWVHFCSGTCWHFSTGTSVHFSEGTFLHLVSGTWRINCDGFREGRSRETVTYIGADFLGSRAAALLWNLLASLMRNLVALGVGHLCRINYVNRTKTMDWKRQTTNLGANVLGELVAIGAGLLPGKEGSIKHLRNTWNSHLHMVTGNFSHLFIVTRRQVSRGSMEHT